MTVHQQEAKLKSSGPQGKSVPESMPRGADLKPKEALTMRSEEDLSSDQTNDVDAALSEGQHRSTNLQSTESKEENVWIA